MDAVHYESREFLPQQTCVGLLDTTPQRTTPIPSAMLEVNIIVGLTVPKSIPTDKNGVKASDGNI